MKKNKLKPSISHTFEIDPVIMDDLDFNFEIPEKNIKKTSEIIIVKKKSKRRKDGSTGLF